MPIELTFHKGVELRDAMRHAFTSQTALAQVVFDQFEQDLNEIGEDDSYREVITQLILWFEKKSRTLELITGTRRGNPGDSKLREFEEEYKMDYCPHAPVSALAQDPQLRSELINTLLTLPVASTYTGRSILLTGVPGNLNRNSDMAHLDFDLIITQLDGLGQLNSGHWPLLLLIENALPYARDFIQPEQALKRVQQILKQKYGSG